MAIELGKRKQTVFAHEVILHRGKHKDSQTVLQLINNFRKVAGLIQHPKMKENQESNTISSSYKDYLKINLTKVVQGLYSENSKIWMRKSKNDPQTVERHVTYINWKNQYS